MDIIKLIEKFSSQKKCIQHLEQIRWKNGAICPYCNSMHATPMAKEKRHKCSSCNRSFSVLVGTVFEATKLPLQKWFVAIFLVMDAKKGISSLQLARHLEVNKDTAWFLQRRIRTAMEETTLLKGIVEVDETYVGANITKMNKEKKSKKPYFKQGMMHRKPVLGMYQRQGKIILKVLEKTNGEEIKPILSQSISQESIVVTDGFGGYYGIGNYYQDHIVLNRSKKKYHIGKYNTNSIEGFWALLKRSVIGIYHKISIKYLQDYLNEIAFKYNYRKNCERFNILVENLINRPFPFAG